MLPDFPRPKAFARGQMVLWMQRQIPIIAPLLADIGRFTQHEGRAGQLTRDDESTTSISYQKGSVRLELTREEMRDFDPAAIQAKLITMAEQFAELQSKSVLQGASEAAESVGNTVNAGGDLRQEHFLEMLEKVELEFDKETGQLAPGFAFVVHPDMVDKLASKMAEWERDPEFQKARSELHQRKLAEWNAREARRALVD
jgi:hypothetical protein